MIPGKKGRIVLTNFQNAPVPITGEAGKGRVVYTGEFFSPQTDIDSWKMLFNLIRYAGKK